MVGKIILCVESSNLTIYFFVCVCGPSEET